MKKTISIIALITILTYGFSFLNEAKKSENLALSIEKTDNLMKPLSNKILPGG